MKLLLVLLALGVRQGHGLDIMKILTGFYHPEALQAVPDLDQILNEHSFRFFEDGKHILESMRPESIRKMIGHVMHLIKHQRASDLEGFSSTFLSLVAEWMHAANDGNQPKLRHIRKELMNLFKKYKGVAIDVLKQALNEIWSSLTNYEKSIVLNRLKWREVVYF